MLQEVEAGQERIAEVIARIGRDHRLEAIARDGVVRAADAEARVVRADQALGGAAGRRAGAQIGEDHAIRLPDRDPDRPRHVALGAAMAELEARVELARPDELPARLMDEADRHMGLLANGRGAQLELVVLAPHSPVGIVFKDRKTVELGERVDQDAPDDRGREALGHPADDAQRLHDDDRPAVVRQGGGSGRQGIVRRQSADAVERRRRRRDDRHRNRGTDPPGAAPPLQSRRARADCRGAFAGVLRAFGAIGRGDHPNRSGARFEAGDVAAEGDGNPDRIVGALAGVVGLQRAAQAPGLDAHDRIGLRVEIVGPAERLRRRWCSPCSAAASPKARSTMKARKARAAGRRGKARRDDAREAARITPRLRAGRIDAGLRLGRRSGRH